MLALGKSCVGGGLRFRMIGRKSPASERGSGLSFPCELGGGCGGLVVARDGQDRSKRTEQALVGGDTAAGCGWSSGRHREPVRQVRRPRLTAGPPMVRCA